MRKLSFDSINFKIFSAYSLCILDTSNDNPPEKKGKIYGKLLKNQI
jgi:hypothetical protein